MAKTIETDLKTFIKFWLVPLGIVVSIFIIFKALTGLIIIGISIFLALALKPLVRKVNGLFTRQIKRDKNHQNISAILAYLIVVLVIGAIVAIVGPVVINETSKYIYHFPETFETTFGGWDGINNFGRSIGVENLQAEIMNGFSNISDNLLGFLGNNIMTSVSSIADIAMKIILVLVLTLLFLLDGPDMLESLWKAISSHDGDNKNVTVARRVVMKMANVVSTYVSRQIIVAMIDGCATMVIVLALSLIFNLPSDLTVPMGMITMAFYLIPMFGQFIGGTLVTILLFFTNPVMAATFAVVYIIYAQLENNLISPKIQGQALKLSPLIILCSVTIGMYMFGLLGAIIAIPIAGCIRVLVEEYPNIKALRN